jgi:hypothetical protein
LANDVLANIPCVQESEKGREQTVRNCFMVVFYVLEKFSRKNAQICAIAPQTLRRRITSIRKPVKTRAKTLS